MKTRNDLLTLAEGLEITQSEIFSTLRIAKDMNNYLEVNTAFPSRIQLTKVQGGKIGYQFPGENVYSEAYKFLLTIK